MTLAGQLIDMAGTMSGGGGKMSSGRMSSKLASDVTPQQLVKLEQKFQSDEKALQVCDLGGPINVLNNPSPHT